MYLILAVTLASVLSAQFPESSVRLYIITVNGKDGYIDRSGKIIMDPKFDALPSRSASTVFWAKLDKNYYLVNVKGEKIIPDPFEKAGAGGLKDKWIFKKNGKWGALDSLGKEVIPFQYDQIGPFSGGFAEASLNGKKGFLDENGAFTPFEEDMIYENDCEGFFVFRKKNKPWGLFDAKNKKIILKEKYSTISCVRRGLVLLKGEHGGIGIYDLAKKEYSVKPDVYEDIVMYTENRSSHLSDTSLGLFPPDSLFFAMRPMNGKGTRNAHYVINGSGREYGQMDTSEIFTMDGLFFSGICPIFRKGYGLKRGLINYKAEVIAEPQFELVRHCSDGLIVAKKDGKSGCLDRNGKIVIPFEYDQFGDFVNGIALVSKIENHVKRTGYIDKNANWIWFNEEPEKQK